MPIKLENSEFELSYGLLTNATWALAQMGDYSGLPYLDKLILESDQYQVRNYAFKLKNEIQKLRN